ncbi:MULTISPECIES: cytochrome c biogenesis CcdA family protein [Paenibacillaceae]|uniref:cytochrome c biogenesis CcdA family protein n=1 Tax=Paenibacillaceae TaxID=186822 RepID=UPI0025B6AA75|nr:MULTISPECIES: cytochrome c biogenesis protein CcdA [Paenibacillaceae]MDN4094599.1 cytochrome c biogenesis protein CcdA [Brevibacillus agri]MED0677508.1 cytochrome c biogenesis protein CcdA [Aneurinibacillus thermoaerophilus]MED3500523.1 cytochrome c biogenesis protein CcdA [Brevibacillus agri]
MENINIYFAFVGGLLSFFSPCIFPLLPAYVANLTGSYVRDNKLVVTKRVVLLRSISFIAGFSLVFVLMGASASIIGQLISDNREIIEKVSGLLIIIFGLQMANILTIPFLMFEKRLQINQNSIQDRWRPFLMGVAFGTGWTPCVGMVLSSILLLAGTSETMNQGIVMLLVYSFGLGIPFLFISIGVTYSLAVVKKINKILPYLNKINGWILIGLGLLLFTGQLQKISAWLATFTPFRF